MTPALSRRVLLAGAGAVILGACSRRGARPSPSLPATPEAKVATTTELLASPRFLVAHRGSGDNWPEHTLAAYLNGLRAGASAVEISVRRTADGVLVCHHDETTARTTGKRGRVDGLKFAQLAERPVDGRVWLGPESRTEPIPKLTDVLAGLPPEALVFIEDKDGTNTAQLLDLLDQQSRATDRFIWKQWAAAAQVGAAAKRGYLTWGFLTPEILSSAAKLAPRFDSVGIGTEQSDDVVSRVVDLGKPVIAWEVHRRSERDRLRRLGVAGLMCSNVPYVLRDSPLASRDQFSSGLRASGDLPMVTNRSWTQQPKIDAAAAALTIDKPTEGLTYLMGSICPLPADGYTLNVTLAWRGDPKDRGAGIAFAAEGDGPYAPNKRNDFGAYQVRVFPNGIVELCDHPEGWPEPRVLGRLLKPEAEARVAEVSVEIAVTPYQITVRRSGRAGQILISDMNHRGGFVHLWTDAAPATFSGISVA